MELRLNDMSDLSWVRLICSNCRVCADSFVASLCCADAEEAKTLIPSIVDKISNEDLDPILEQINKLRTVKETR